MTHPYHQPTSTITAITWCDLVVKAPGLQRFEVEAREAAGNGATWWPAWLHGYSEFMWLLSNLSDRRAAYNHLKAVFHAERERLVQASRPQLAASPASPPASSRTRPRWARR
jgi:hypothetical protein